MWIDAHAHFEQWDHLKEKEKPLLQRFQLDHVLIPGVHPTTIHQAKRVHDMLPEQISFGIGIHPMHANEGPLSRHQAMFEEALATYPSCTAVGECGLDKRYLGDGETFSMHQVPLFEMQLLSAKDKGLPVIIHMVGAIQPTLDLIKKHGPFPAGGMMHGYTGPAELIAEWNKHGFMISFGGAILQKNAHHVLKAVAATPAPMLLIESDATLSSGRGLELAAEVGLKVAEIRQEKPEGVARQIKANLRQLLEHI